jgi:hypothetical protein
MGYWGDVTSISWRETKQSFGWTKKTAATVLLALGGIITAYLKLGWAGMTESAAGYFRIGLAPIFAGLILFAWNFVEAQSLLYAKMVADYRAEVSELQNRLAEFDEPKPNYEAWRHVDQLTVRKAAFLWCDLEPRISMTKNVTAWYEALISAIKKNELDFIPELTGYMDASDEKQMQRRRPDSHTIITRKQLKAFAAKHNYDPIFLRDA